MSAIIENSTSASKSPQLSFSKLNGSPTVNSALKCQETQRFSSGKERVSKRLNDIYLKTTERNISNQVRKSPVMLSEQSSPDQQKTERWNFENVEEENREEIKGIEFFLESQGLLEVFNCFEQFRNVMIQSLSQEDSSNSIKAQIDLYHSISSLKNELSHINMKTQEKQENIGLEQSLSEDNQQKNFLISQISQLRAENQIIKDKYNKIYHELHHSETQDSSIQNSLINNSISYGNSSIQSSELTEKEENCFTLDFKMDKIDHHYLPCAFGSKSTTISFENSASNGNQQKFNKILAEVESFESSRVISQQSSYEVECQPQNIVFCDCRKQQWIELVSKSLSSMKEIFRHHFQASNLALAKSPQLHNLQSILKSYKQFNSSGQSQSEQSFLKNSQEFLDFITIHSVQIAQLVSQQIIRVKSKSKK